MKNWFKRGLFALVVFVIVALIGGAVFLLTFNPNAYKNKVEQMVYDRYQRHLRIDGEIELSLFPRIGLSVEQVSLSQKNSEDPFAAVDSARFAVAVWPLIWNRLVVDHVAVSGFKVWLERDEDGEFNFTDLLQKGNETPITQTQFNVLPIAVAQAQSHSLVPDANQAEFQIDIAGLDLKEGEIHFSDQPSETQMRLVNVELNTGRMTFGQPFDVIFKGLLQGDRPTADATLEGQAVVQLEPQLKRYAAQRINLSLVGDVGPYKANSATLRGGLELLTLTEDLRARNIELLTQGRWQDESLTVNKTQLNLQVAQLNLKRNLRVFNTQKLQVRLNGVLPVPEGQAEHKIEFALDVPRMDIDPEQIQGEPVAASFKQQQGAVMFGLNGRAKDFSGTLDSLQLGQVQIDVANKAVDTAWKLGATASAQWQQDALRLSWQDLDAHLLLEDEALNPNPANAKLTGNGEWSWSEQAGLFQGLWQSANTHAQLSTHVKHDQHWQFGVEVQAQELDMNPWLSSTKPVQLRRQSDKANVAHARMLPDYFDWRTLHTQLNVSADELTVQQLKLSQVQLEAEQKDRAITLKKLAAELFDGKVNGSGLWQHDRAEAELNVQLKDIDLQKFSQSADSHISLTGRGDIEAKLKTQGRTELAQRAALAGLIQLKAKDGQVIGWDVWQHLRSANEAVRNVFSGQIQAPTELYTAEQATSFKNLELQLQLENGQGIFKKLQWQTDGLKMKAEPFSYVDVVNKQMDMDLRFDLIKKTLPPEYADLVAYTSHPLFVRFSGMWAAPRYRLQWQRLDHPAVQQAIDNGLLGLLGRPDLGSIIEATVPVQPTTDTSKSLGNTLKDLLKTK